MPRDIKTDKKETNINRKNQVCGKEGVKDPYYVDQTTLISPETSFIILSYKTALSPGGVNFTIGGIEYSQMRSLNTTFVQRNAKIEGNPRFVLSQLYQLINYNKEAKTILLWGDDDDLYEEIDLETYKGSKDKVQFEVKYPEDGAEENVTDISHIKKISITLGDEDAYYNYNGDLEDKPERDPI